MTTDWEPSIAQPTGQSPLRDFKGNLSGISHRDGEYEGRTFRNVLFDFTDLEVLESTEVYPFPVAQISIRYADPSRSRGGTAWAAFSESCRQLLGDGAQVIGLLNKRQRWAMRPAKLRSRTEEGAWVDVDGEAFRVVEVEGISGSSGPVVSVMDAVLKLLDGKTEKDFNEAAFADSQIRGDADMVDRIVNRKLLPQLKEESRADVDAEGVWHLSLPIPPVAPTTIEEAES